MGTNLSLRLFVSCRTIYFSSRLTSQFFRRIASVTLMPVPYNKRKMAGSIIIAEFIFRLCKIRLSHAVKKRSISSSVKMWAVKPFTFILGILGI